jgi:hypothetical protein
VEASVELWESKKELKGVKRERKRRKGGGLLFSLEYLKKD